MLQLLWDFSRPHTIIGSFLSITTLYLLACQGTDPSAHLGLYGMTLLSALACNVFITGLNQITDRDMDAINKPFLPIAAGRLSVRGAWQIILTALAVAVVAAGLVSQPLLLTITAIVLIGVAYSVPPLRLKQHHLPAALCIVVVRGLIVNLGIGFILDTLVNGAVVHRAAFWLLAIFVSMFSIAIAWFKDLYDTEGDEQYKVRTFAVLYSIRTAYTAGNIMVIGAYLLAIVCSLRYIAPGGSGLAVVHGALLLLFVAHIWNSSVDSREGIYRFYMRFWLFFFAEYGVFILYALIS
jgi:homogentisate phytyltransferase / homogentisate geranylgeranyltransferase